MYVTVANNAFPLQILYLKIITCVSARVSVTSLGFSANGRFLVTGSYDETVRLWTVEGELERSLSIEDWVLDVSFSPDDQLIAVGLD